MQIETIVSGPLDNNIFIIWQEGETVCGVIDPSAYYASAR